MNILHIINSIDPSQGGPPESVIGLASSQARLTNNKVTILTNKDSRSSHQLQEYYNFLNYNHVRLVELKYRNILDRLFSILSNPILRQEILYADIVHIHGLWQPLLMVAAKLSKKFKIPYVIAPRGMLTPWSLNQKKLKKIIALQLIWKKILQNAGFVHMLTRDEVEISLSDYLPKKVEIIANGVFIKEKPKSKDIEELYLKYPILKDKRYVVFVGRLHHVKGIDCLIEAFRIVAQKNNGVDLVIVGPDWGERSALETQVSKLNLQERVHFLGPVFGNDKYNILSRALFLCQISRQEGFSMTIIEAMAEGIPVIISEQCRFPEVADKDAGEITDLNSISVSKAILKLINNDDLRKKAGLAAKKIIEKNYSWPTIADITISKYEQLLNTLDTKHNNTGDSGI